MALLVKNLPANPWVGKIPGVGSGNPLQYSCLEKPMDRGTWQATVHEVAESDWVTTTFTLIVMNPQIFDKLIFSPLAQYHK